MNIERRLFKRGKGVAMGKGMEGKQVVKVTGIHAVHKPVFIKPITLSSEFIPIKSCKTKRYEYGGQGLHLSNQIQLCLLMGFFQGMCTGGSYSSSLNLPSEVGKHHAVT